MGQIRGAPRKGCRRPHKEDRHKTPIFEALFGGSVLVSWHYVCKISHQKVVQIPGLESIQAIGCFQGLVNLVSDRPLVFRKWCPEEEVEEKEEEEEDEEEEQEVDEEEPYSVMMMMMMMMMQMKEDRVDKKK